MLQTENSGTPPSSRRSEALKLARSVKAHETGRLDWRLAIHSNDDADYRVGFRSPIVTDERSKESFLRNGFSE
jgi:hypothetical protein